MIKLLIFIVVVLLIGFGFTWLADRPGDLVINWQGEQIETSLLVGVAFVVALVVAILIVWWLVRVVFTSPRLMRRHIRRRKRDRGYEALSTGLLAAGAGDASTANRMNKRAQSLLSARKEPLIHMLEAQTALVEGDHERARAKFESMADDPRTRDLALRGLYLEARRLNAEEAARHYAEQAVGSSPHLPWAGQASLEYRCREGDWDGAIRLLEKQRMARIVKREDADRKKAVLLTARAIERLDGDPRGARDDALEAVRLAPGLVPASVTAAKALFREDNLRRGTKVLERSWKNEPHPEVGEAYVRARIGDSVLDRLKRAERLEALKPNHIESLLAVAHAALDAQQFGRAREKAEAAARQQSRESVYLLLADVEEADTGDQGRVRHWLSQAVRAQRDPAWTADGYVSEKWAAVSPVTGELDAFVWRAPIARLSPSVEHGPAIGHDPHDKQAEQAFRTLPPVSPQPQPVTPAEAEDVTVEAEVVPPAKPAPAPAAPVAVKVEEKPAASVEKTEAAASPVPSANAADTAEAKPSKPATETAAKATPAPASPVQPKTSTSADGRRPVRADEKAQSGTGNTGRSERAEQSLGRAPDDPGVDAKDPSETPKRRFGLF